MSKNFDNKLILQAKRYADAILEVAKSKSEMDRTYEDLKTVSSVYDSSEDLRNFLVHPVIPIKEKKDTIKTIFEGKVTDDVLHFLYILLDKNKLSLLDTILYCYEDAMDEAKNILKVDVVSAVDVDSDQKEALRMKLQNKLQKEIKLHFEINPEIIAGLILKIGDKTIDGSMSNKLDNLQRQLV